MNFFINKDDKNTVLLHIIYTVTLFIIYPIYPMSPNPTVRNPLLVAAFLNINEKNVWSTCRLNLHKFPKNRK